VFLNAGALDAGRSTLHRNSATRGGAIFQGGTAVSQISNSLFYTNTTTAGYGGGVRAEDGVITMTHVTFADNVNGAGYSQSGGSGAAHDSIAWANDNGGFWIAGGTFTSTCNIDQTGAEGINIDPQFVAPGAGEDYHLSYGSPAVDACPAGLPTDLDHVSRPIGDGYDMGAYEYAYAVALAPDNVGTGEPSSVVTYTHALTNTGGRTDT
jgi:hypothetical protein